MMKVRSDGPTIYQKKINLFSERIQAELDLKVSKYYTYQTLVVAKEDQEEEKLVNKPVASLVIDWYYLLIEVVSASVTYKK